MMSGPPSFLQDPDSTREELMRATYDALTQHGYADLTIERIAAEFPKSKSLIYHHYDGKDALLLDFLEFMLERFENTVEADSHDDPNAALDTLLDLLLVEALTDGRGRFPAAMVELRAQAVHDPAFREYFTRSDRAFQRRFAELLVVGIDAGQYREVDVDGTASMLLTVVNGAMTARMTSDELDVHRLRREVDRWLDHTLGRRP